MYTIKRAFCNCYLRWIKIYKCLNASWIWQFFRSFSLFFSTHTNWIHCEHRNEQIKERSIFLNEQKKNQKKNNILNEDKFICFHFIEKGIEFSIRQFFTLDFVLICGHRGSTDYSVTFIDVKFLVFITQIRTVVLVDTFYMNKNTEKFTYINHSKHFSWSVVYFLLKNLWQFIVCV